MIQRARYDQVLPIYIYSYTIITSSLYCYEHYLSLPPFAKMHSVLASVASSLAVFIPFLILIIAITWNPTKVNALAFPNHPSEFLSPDTPSLLGLEGFESLDNPTERTREERFSQDLREELEGDAERITEEEGEEEGQEVLAIDEDDVSKEEVRRVLTKLAKQYGGLMWRRWKQMFLFWLPQNSESEDDDRN